MCTDVRKKGKITMLQNSHKEEKKFVAIVNVDNQVMTPIIWMHVGKASFYANNRTIPSMDLKDF